MGEKTTGTVRHLDSLGRIVVPVEFRRGLGIGERAAMEIKLLGDHVELWPLVADCVFCGETDDLREYKGRQVCRTCREQVARA